MVITLNPGHVSFPELELLYREKVDVALVNSVWPHIEQAARKVVEACSGDTPVYGVNTGFGKLANIQIAADDAAQLQRNLVLSHCCGVGEETPAEIVRLMMILKVMSLARGASGVHPDTVLCLLEMINKGVLPVIPSQGSVGASGDLAPLAHMAAVMIGESEAIYQGVRMPGIKALQRAGVEPVSLGPKEGLALINGTQFSTAYALAGLFETWRNALNAIVASALSTDAIMGSTAPLRPEIHVLRGHLGQIEVAAVMRMLLEGSEIRESHREDDSRVQDPYCIRCQPQVTGAALDLLRQAGNVLAIEANAVTDNPLVTEAGILSGGNFHAEPVAFAADQIALAAAEIGAISQRRTALMVDPTLSFDLPPFLTPEPGLNSGFMIAEVTTAALMSENKHLANPCSTDSTPTSANQEDHVSMAAHGSRRLMQINRNLSCILGIEYLCAAQGIVFRSPLKTSLSLQQVIDVLHEQIPPIAQDRYLAGDLALVSKMVSSFVLIESLQDFPMPVLGQMRNETLVHGEKE
ncbi:MAG: histidine ammonia-lyase [Pseudomonadota bacterium]